MIEILTVDEVAELLRISRNRIILLARRGDLPSFVIDGRLRFDAKEIEHYLRANRRSHNKQEAKNT